VPVVIIVVRSRVTVNAPSRRSCGADVPDVRHGGSDSMSISTPAPTLASTGGRYGPRRGLAHVRRQILLPPCKGKGVSLPYQPPKGV